MDIQNQQWWWMNKLSVIGASSFLIAPSVWAQDLQCNTQHQVGVQSQDKMPISTCAGVLLTQDSVVPAISTLQNLEGSVRVTGVKLDRTESGIQLILETETGVSLTPVVREDGNTLVAEITNAVLALPGGETFRSENPFAGIATISVTQSSATTIRVSVVGSNAIPSLQVQPGAGTTLVIRPERDSEETSSELSEEEEITVTAEAQRDYRVPNATTGTRTDTPLRDIPRSIQVVPQQVLQDQQVTRLDEALRNVSGVTGSSVEGSGFRFGIRGFDRANVLLDGFNISASDNFSRSGFQDLSETANLEQIEVLKGPASVLFGEINPGGVINLVTKKPLTEPFFEGEFQLGSRDFFQPRIDISGPLTADKKVAYRLNALVRNDSGFRGFDQNIQRIFVAPALTWNISDRTNLTFNLEFLDDKRPYDTGTLAFGRGVIDLPRDRIVNEPGDFTERTTLSTGYTLNHQFSDNWQIRNAFRYIKQDVSASVAIPFSFNEATGNLIRLDSSVENYRESYALQTNVIGKFVTGPIKHTLLFGVDLSKNSTDLLTLANTRRPLPLNVFNPIYNAFPRDRNQQIVALDEQIETRRLGIYLQDQIALADNLKLVAGLRYDTVEQTLNSARTPTSLGGNQSQNPDAVTPNVGIVYQPIPALSLYASYSRSFTPNSGVTIDRTFLEPEEGEGYEVGVKAEVIPNRLFATLAYYNITKQNVASPDPNFPTLSNVSVATGEQRSRGFEFDLVGEITPGWNLIASYAYTDAEVTRDTVIPIGNRLVGVPKHSASLWTTYTIQRGDLRGLGFGVGFNYVGNRAGDLNNSFELGDYFLTNAAIYYRRDNWRLAVNFKNLFNVDYIQGSPFSRLRNLEVGEPFTVIGSFSVQF
jgi:iron complex outermembrane recepter protein